MRISLVIPVYYNAENLKPLYTDIKQKLYSHSEYEWELVMVNDGSKDNSWAVMQKLAEEDSRIKTIVYQEISAHMQQYCADYQIAQVNVRL